MPTNGWMPTNRWMPTNKWMRTNRRRHLAGAGRRRRGSGPAARPVPRRLGASAARSPRAGRREPATKQNPQTKQREDAGRRQPARRRRGGTQRLEPPSGTNAGAYCRIAGAAEVLRELCSHPAKQWCGTGSALAQRAPGAAVRREAAEGARRRRGRKARPTAWFSPELHAAARP